MFTFKVRNQDLKPSYFTLKDKGLKQWFRQHKMPFVSCYCCAGRDGNPDMSDCFEKDFWELRE